MSDSACQRWHTNMAAMAQICMAWLKCMPWLHGAPRFKGVARIENPYSEVATLLSIKRHVGSVSRSPLPTRTEPSFSGWSSLP